MPDGKNIFRHMKPTGKAEDRIVPSVNGSMAHVVYIDNYTIPARIVEHIAKRDRDLLTYTTTLILESMIVSREGQEPFFQYTIRRGANIMVESCYMMSEIEYRDFIEYCEEKDFIPFSSNRIEEDTHGEIVA
jgi:hypothetical protein